MNTKGSVCPVFITFVLFSLSYSLNVVNGSFRNNIQNRKRIVEKRSVRNGNNNFRQTNALKDALLNAIESSSNEDFDVLDVLYVVAKTYKDEQYLNDKTSDGANKNQENVKRMSNKRKR